MVDFSYELIDGLWVKVQIGPDGDLMFPINEKDKM